MCAQDIFDSSVARIPGCGAKRREAFERLGIFSFRELLYHFPRGYQNRGAVRSLAEAAEGVDCSLMLTVATEARTSLLKNRMTLTKFRAFDESGSVSVIYFNASYISAQIEVGAQLRFWGRLSHAKDGSLQLVSPELERTAPDAALPDFVSIYPLTAGLTRKLVSSAIAYVLDNCSIALLDPIPDEVRAELELPPIARAMEMIHRPRSLEDIEQARRRFSFEELYLFSRQLHVCDVKESSSPLMLRSQVDLKSFMSALPFRLTGAQTRVIGEIAHDMLMFDVQTDIPQRTERSGEPLAAERPPMKRMMSGDVGSGKTICAAAAVFIAARCGWQTALMAPTEILAEQHFESLSGLFAPLGISVGLLTGSTPTQKRRELLRQLESGELDVLIGTQALFSENVKYFRLGLCVIDEQHRFGVSQRSALVAKAELPPHTLIMSATPIPRSLAMFLYGDLALSEVNELPPGRIPVKTFVAHSSTEERFRGFLMNQIKQGGQAYIVCPAIENEPDVGNESYDVPLLEPDYAAGQLSLNISEALPNNKKKPVSAVEYAAELVKEYPELRVGVLHGRLSASEKSRIMSEFAAGELDVLVATTVVEVGVNVPNASLMCVQNSERFGLSQLHQLRGRVGRGSRESFCVLMTDAERSDPAYKRLMAMRELYDGFEIARRDLELRGPGDFLKLRDDGDVRQHGALRFRLAGACPDMELMRAASEFAKRSIESEGINP